MDQNIKQLQELKEHYMHKFLTMLLGMAIVLLVPATIYYAGYIGDFLGYYAASGPHPESISDVELLFHGVLYLLLITVVPWAFYRIGADFKKFLSDIG